ncbi:MAG TPA: hypothetical protein VH108_06855 [Gaiellaceae bacterium]|nr:hypothetical protein [Gaiellaceae bacterium]
MWWALGGLGAFIYIVLVITLGLTTLRKGHWVLFFLGFPFPLFWLFGALGPSREQTV